MLRCAIHHLKGGLFVFLLKTTCFCKVVCLHRKQSCKKHVVLGRNTSTLPEDGIWHTETCRSNVVKYIYMRFSWYIWGVKRLGIFRTVCLLSRSGRKVLPCRSVPGWRGQRTQVYLQPFQTAWCKKSTWLSGRTFEPFLKGHSTIWFSWRKLRFGGFLAYRGDTRPTPCRNALDASRLPVPVILFSVNLLLTYSDSFKLEFLYIIYIHTMQLAYICVCVCVCVCVYIYIYIYGSYLAENMSFRKNNYLMLMREIISAYCDNHCASNGYATEEETLPPYIIP
jgi:hypothetical protein